MLEKKMNAVVSTYPVLSEDEQTCFYQQVEQFEDHIQDRSFQDKFLRYITHHDVLEGPFKFREKFGWAASRLYTETAVLQGQETKVFEMLERYLDAFDGKKFEEVGNTRLLIHLAEINQGGASLAHKVAEATEDLAQKRTHHKREYTFNVCGASALNTVNLHKTATLSYRATVAAEKVYSLAKDLKQPKGILEKDAKRWYFSAEFATGRVTNFEARDPVKAALSARRGAEASSELYRLTKDPTWMKKSFAARTEAATFFQEIGEWDNVAEQLYRRGSAANILGKQDYGDSLQGSQHWFRLAAESMIRSAYTRDNDGHFAGQTRHRAHRFKEAAKAIFGLNHAVATGEDQSYLRAEARFLRKFLKMTEGERRSHSIRRAEGRLRSLESLLSS